MDTRNEVTEGIQAELNVTSIFSGCILGRHSFKMGEGKAVYHYVAYLTSHAPLLLTRIARFTNIFKFYALCTKLLNKGCS